MTESGMLPRKLLFEKLEVTKHEDIGESEN